MGRGDTNPLAQTCDAATDAVDADDVVDNAYAVDVVDTKLWQASEVAPMHDHCGAPCAASLGSRLIPSTTLGRA